MHLRPLIVATLVGAVALSALAGSSSGTLPDVPDPLVRLIEEKEIRKHLEFLASEELGGRYTMSPQLAIVNRYLASRLASYGYRGAADEGSFLQKYTIRSSKIDSEQSRLRLTVDGTESTYEYGDFSSRTGGQAHGDVFFVGFGISAPELGHDDYAGIDVKGKIVLAVPGTPASLDESRLLGDMRGAKAARKAGAVAYFSLPQKRFLRFIDSPTFQRFLRRRGSVRLAGRDQGIDVMLTPNSLKPLLERMNWTIDGLYRGADEGHLPPPQALPMRADVGVVMNDEDFEAANVAAVLEGADPELRDQYILISAHQDHLKTNDEGQVFPGADDDGSGISALLAIAKAYAASPPRRSVLIMFHSGEENGLLGSLHNTTVDPVVPLERIVANLNIDMIGRSRAADDTKSANRSLTDVNTVYVIGADRISRELHEINELTNADGESLTFDYTFNDPSRPERYYYRSDHWNYAQKGVPIIFFFTGTHEDYHRTTDTVEKIDFTKMTRIARHVFSVGWRLANLDHRLKVDE